MCCRQKDDMGDECCQTVLECIAEKVTDLLVERLVEINESGVPAQSIYLEE